MSKHRFDFSVCKSVVSAAALAGLVSTAVLFIAGPAAAASKNGGGQPDTCNTGLAVCQKSCANELDWCWKDCEKKFMACKPVASKASNASQRIPPTGGVKGDSKKTPTSNSKIPPRVNDTRPPLGGGVFGRPQTTGAGSGGPIVLRSNGGSGMGAGNGAPIMRSAGGRR